MKEKNIILFFLCLIFVYIKADLNERNIPKEYKNLKQIEEELKKISINNPVKTKLIDISSFIKQKTFNNNSIYCLKISSNSLKDEDKPNILIAATSHAREIINAEITLSIINNLLKNESYFLNLLNTYQFFVLPVMNPDGYDFVFKNDRLWRKNRFESI
jgi:extracellular matrix protein 14